MRLKNPQKLMVNDIFDARSS